MVLLRATVSTISIGHDRRRYFCREEVLILCKKKKNVRTFADRRFFLPYNKNTSWRPVL